MEISTFLEQFDLTTINSQDITLEKFRELSDKRKDDAVSIRSSQMKTLTSDLNIISDTVLDFSILAREFCSSVLDMVNTETAKVALSNIKTDRAIDEYIELELVSIGNMTVGIDGITII